MSNNQKFVDELQVRGQSYDIVDVRSRDSITALQNFIAPVESSSTLTRNYTVGQYFIYNDTIYKVLQNISSGTSMSIGTNCVQFNPSIIMSASVVGENLILSNRG